MSSCSNGNDLDTVISNEWNRCASNQNVCTIDLATAMPFDWDTMYFFSSANSLEDINKNLGFELKVFTDIGDRVVFIKNGKVVYHKEWFPNPSEFAEGIIFMTKKNMIKFDKLNAKFSIRKKGKAFYLEKVE